MSQSALTILPMLFALTACAPATESAADALDSAAAAAESGSAEVSGPSDASATDLPDQDGSPTAGGAEGGAPPPGSPPEPVVIAGPGLDESCQAGPVQDVVGKMPDESLVRDAVARSGAKTVRVIPHDGMVTMDYRGDRLNIQLDESGKITAVNCG